MYNHAPDDYVCPFCRIAAGLENDDPYTLQQDVVWRDEATTAYVSSTWWPRNAGHVIVIPNAHFENIFDLPADLAAAIHTTAQKIALALKTTYNCDGISTRQHNEPGGYQEVWHYHLHVFPRYFGDNLYLESRRLTKPAERLPYAQKLKAFLQSE